VLFDVAAKVWTGDRLVLDTFTSHQPQGLPLSAGLPAWRHLAGQRVGSRVLEVVPPRDGFGRRGDAAVNVSGTDTLVFVFDILAAVPSAGHASGTVVRGRPGAGLPQVTNSAHGPVVLVPPRAAPPKKLVTRVLIAGHGPRLVPGETVVTQFTGVLWRTRAVFDSSWRHGDPQSFVLGSSQVIAGWNRALAGQRVGSRVLLVIPPGLGYGKAGNPPAISGTDTLVFVIDILAASHG
jgi:peptidylprolyl isomerase